MSDTSRHEISQSRPSVGEAGRTGDWRSARPVVTLEVCVAVKQGKASCQRCWVYCPDACISRGIGPVIDLDHCKGCGICAEVCPHHAIAMQPETEGATCPAPAEESR